ncbi:MAG: chemotaxis-specific protein-glutamate methyltransferase CheB [Gammaproteobacteria bacterium]|nr:chemotaxis-specific protein-glutamate methyltransferase CheB [Gammaproteobacteria bacterium]MCF6231037.1 chemotaxis-specific protein-glutamate methyltransferase CheB [Gammaproteobacteria bacterium]
MRIAIVNDKPAAIELLREIIASTPHRIAWIAHDGDDAVARCITDRPDLIFMDMAVPGMNGVEVTKAITTSATPSSVLLVTESLVESASMVFEAMGAGALDVVEVPKGTVECAELLSKLRRIEKLLGLKAVQPIPTAAMGKPVAKINLLAIGSSTGGPNAVAEVVKSLPADFPAAIVVIQHVDEAFAGGFVEWLSTQAAMKVKVAENGDQLQHGTIYVAATNNHLICDAIGRLKYTEQHQEIVYRPSVDVFFNSLGTFWQDNLLAVLLTGMGKDGAAGLLRLRKKGVYTIAQDQATCAVYGMPRAAAEIGAAKTIQPLGNISRIIKQQIKNLTQGSWHDR